MAYKFLKENHIFPDVINHIILSYSQNCDDNIMKHHNANILLLQNKILMYDRYNNFASSCGIPQLTWIDSLNLWWWMKTKKTYTLKYK
jgi:hypothetical protein